VSEPAGPASRTPRTLVAGIGNVFLSDDAFGVEVARLLAARSLPDGVRAEDYGIRGLHLAYDLLDGYDTLVLLDAVPMGEPAGTLSVIEPELTAEPSTEGRANDDDDTSTAAGVPMVDAHTMSPDVVLATLDRLGGKVERVLILWCQPAVLREGMELSPAVAAAIEPAADLCLEVLADLVRLGSERLEPVSAHARPDPTRGGTPT
jgi:hydrogenase maturation protease